MRLPQILLPLLLCPMGLIAQAPTPASYLKEYPPLLAMPISGDSTPLEASISVQSSGAQEGGRGKETKVRSQFITIAPSKLSELSLAILSRGEQQAPLLALIERISSPVADSQLNLYTTDWQAVDGQGILPKIDRQLFIPNSDSSHAHQRLNALLSPLYLTQTWREVEGKLLLEIKVSLPQTWEDEQDDQLQVLITQLPTLRYHWQGQRFEPYP